MSIYLIVITVSLGFEYFNFYFWSQSAAKEQIIHKVILTQAKSSHFVGRYTSIKKFYFQNSFVDLVDQYGMQEYVSEFVAAFLQAAIQAVHETVNDNMRVTMLNTFLLTQDLPAINVRKLTQSSLKILSKLTNYVSTWKVDAKKLEKLVNDFVFEFEKNYLPIEKLLQQVICFSTVLFDCD